MASAVQASRDYMCSTTGLPCSWCSPGPCCYRVHDCGGDPEDFGTGAMRQTGGKGRCDLLPFRALLRVSRHMEAGCAKYPERNWELGMPMHSMLDSALRHLMQYMDGSDDEDHLAAAATNLLMAMWTEEMHPEMQDIPARSREYVPEATERPSEARGSHARPSGGVVGAEGRGEAPRGSGE